MKARVVRSKLRFKGFLRRRVTTACSAWMFGTVFVMLLGCGHDSSLQRPANASAQLFDGQANLSEGQQESQIVAILRSAPPWDKITKESAKNDLPALRNSILAISRYPLPIIRRACQRYFDEANKVEDGLRKEDVSKVSSLSILNRFLFAVPAEEPERRKIRFFGAWWAGADRRHDMLWPLRETDFGLVIDGVYQGYFGPDYEAMAEFDYYRDTYGPRSNPKWAP